MKSPYLIASCLLLGAGILSLFFAQSRPHTHPEILADAPLKRASRQALTNKQLPPRQETPAPAGIFSEFKALSQSTLERLPRTDDLQGKTSEEVHFSPPELFAASPSLGAIATQLRERPELIAQGIVFYDECARREDVLAPVRILCLRNLKHWSAQQPDVLPFDRHDFPEELWNVAESLPPVRP